MLMLLLCLLTKSARYRRRERGTGVQLVKKRLSWVDRLLNPSELDRVILLRFEVLYGSDGHDIGMQTMMGADRSVQSTLRFTGG